MKIILLIVAVMIIHSFVFGQDMKGMEMPKKENRKKSEVKKKTKVVLVPVNADENMQMPKDTSKEKKMDMGNMKMPVHSPDVDSMESMNMPENAETKSIGNRVEYYLDVTDTLVSFAKGKLKPAIAINGTIPAPTLYFTEGDTAIIYVHNLMKKETSIHWHGLLLPNAEDGVPNLTTPPIEPGSTFTFSFPIIQTGRMKKCQQLCAH